MWMNNKMKRKNIILLIGFCSVFLLIGGFYNWLYSPLPSYEGKLSIPKLVDSVNVYTDTYGVPHIFASNEEDLFFTAGYLAARERLFQLSTVALAVKGELSSALGDDLLKTDIYLRTWKIHRTAKEIIKAMDPQNRKIFETFCDGINYHIEEVSDDLPIEFKILGFKPSKWDPSIVAGYARMMAHEMQGSWKAEIVFGAIENYFGSEKLLEIIPGANNDVPTIASSSISGLEKRLNNILSIENKLRGLFGDPSADIGSNSWVLSGENTTTGKPFLANDPHLAFSQPSRWYEIHLKGGRFNVSGLCLAGIPLPVIGQNEKTAWGFTNTMVDDVDFFIEKIHSSNPNKYKHGEEWLDIKSVREKIPLKNGRDTTIVFRSTHHGPIISDVHPLVKEKSLKVISLSWTGHWITSEMDAWVQLCTMKNWDDFSKAVELFGVPGQNIIYADVDGNIGWRPAVYIPIRREAFSMTPKPGENPAYDWKGRVPFSEMPYLYNPKKGFISTANNKTIDESFPYYVSGLWADPSRARVIQNNLENKKKFSLKDMKNIQLDYTSEFAQFVLPYIIKQNISNSTISIDKAMGFLKSWDCVESKDSEAALVFHSIVKQLVKNIYYDELSLLGEDYFDAFSSLKYFVHRKLRELLSNRTSTWVDDINTKDKIETMDDIIEKSILDGVLYIENNYGPNWSNWKWGDAHDVTHKHILSKSKLLNLIFNLNVGPFKSGGSDKTPNAGGYDVTKSFQQTAGASMRRIVDFSNLDNTQIVLPTGQSGLQKSMHYKDQSKLYHSGAYRITYFSDATIQNLEGVRKLTIAP